MKTTWIDIFKFSREHTQTIFKINDVQFAGRQKILFAKDNKINFVQEHINNKIVTGINSVPNYSFNDKLLFLYD